MNDHICQLDILLEKVYALHTDIVDLNDQLDAQAKEITSLRRNLATASTWINELLDAGS